MSEEPRRTFLLEVRSEEIPARMLRPAMEELASGLLSELVALEVVPGTLETAFTPRRLVVLLRELPARTPDRTRLEVGPPAQVAFDAHGNPTQAAIGFARKFSVSVADLTRRHFDRDGRPAAPDGAGSQERVVLERTVPGIPLQEVLAEKVPMILRRLSWPKTMRWGVDLGPWVRPVHGIVMLLDSDIVTCELFGVESGRVTCGHRVVAPQKLVLNSATEYEARLAEHGVVVDPRKREAQLLEKLTALAAQNGGELIPDSVLLERLVAVCECPGVVCGGFEERFLVLPEEILRTSLRDHQSAFSVRSQNGKLLPVFLTVMDRPDDPQGFVQKGNEWVIAARLEDALFFWNKDRERPLEELAPRLAGLAVHEQLGSYAEKTERLVTLVGELVGRCATPDLLRAVGRAASFAKLDLVTGMVGEFPDLQGVVGGLYLREQGESFEVWSAVYDHYLPTSAEDNLPRSETGRLLALADRCDHLVGFFSLGESCYPTGSRDPFALRRAALAVARLALAGSGPEDLSPIFRRAVEDACHQEGRAAVGKTFSALSGFLRERLAYLLEREGLPVPVVAAALGSSAPALALRPLARRARALAKLLANPELGTVAQAFKRISNILKGVEVATFDRCYCNAPAEIELYEAFESIESELGAGVESGDIASALQAASRLAQPLDRFFLEVLVMDPDVQIRANRLGLLTRLRDRLLALADLSRIVA